MRAVNKKIIRIIDYVERRVRSSFRKLTERQRIEFDPEQVRLTQGATMEMIQDWESSFYDWFKAQDKYFRWAWFESVKHIRVGGIKTSIEELYWDYIDARALTIGSELAGVNAAVIGRVLQETAGMSWTSTKRKLKECIGLHPRQMSALIKQSERINKLYPPERAAKLIERLRNKKLNYRAQLIARTEIGNAVSEAQLRDIKDKMAMGELPVQMEKSWSTVGDNNVSDGCLENEAAGWISIDGTFPSGHERPQRFPGCRCALQFRRAVA